MLEVTKEMYSQRVDEINFYINQLSDIENEIIILQTVDNQRYVKIMKSNSVLMIYNLVESVVKNGIEEIYHKIRQEGLTYDDLSSRMKEVWFNFRFESAKPYSANYDTYKNVAINIVNQVMSREVILLDQNAIKHNGNLDAENIRKICFYHGIELDISKKAKGGIALTKVKSTRNDLAHGAKLFSECGRDFSLKDLTDIFEETKYFLSDFLSSVEEYCEQSLYKHQAG